MAIHPQHRQWHMAMPTGRHPTIRPGAPAGSPTYGSYFTAARDYLCSDGRTAILKAARCLLNRRVATTDILGLNIHLAKHGALYHPALVTVQFHDDQMQLALNVAASPAGRRVIRDEYDLLQRLNRNFPQKFIPQVYGYGQGRPANGSSVLGALNPMSPMPPMPMFLAQWFHGFYEFHVGAAQPAGSRWRIWDDDQGHRWLTPQQVADAYGQAAEILTTYYDPISFTAVLDWHNAAGDFVLRPHAGGIEVRLITVRRYARFIQRRPQDTPSLAEVLATMILFLLRISLWLRLDRIDGVGDLVWAHDLVLSPIWQGFVRGLNTMARIGHLPDEMAAAVPAYLSAHSTHEIKIMAAQMTADWPAATPEKALIHRHLESHVRALMDIVRTFDGKGHPDDPRPL